MPRPVAALLTLCAASAHAHVYSLSVSGDRRRVMDLGVFGFGDEGVARLRVKELSLADTGAESSDKHIGFTLDRVSTALLARQQKNHGKGELAYHGICYIDEEAVRPDPDVPQSRTLFPMESVLKGGSPASHAFEVNITQTGLYALFFYNCKRFYNDTDDAPREVPVTFDVEVTLFNVDAGHPSYASYGKRDLPEIYAGFTAIYCAMLAYWVRLTMTPKAVQLHHLITMLLAVKTLTLFFEAGKEFYFRDNGVKSTWSYLYYIFLTIRGILLFTVILLIGTGWSFLKPFLTQKDKQIISVVVPLQVLVHIAIGYIEDTSEGDPLFLWYKDMLMVLDTICCCSVLLPIIWSIKQLSETKEMDGKEVQNLTRLKQFRTFYIIVVGYLYFTRICVPFVETLLPYTHTFLAPFLSEAASLAFYLFSGYRFQPADDVPDAARLPAADRDAEERDTRPLRSVSVQ
eukprot:TRINITY_DN7142_c0_g1_i1.p1 TRINITY_DN7142_c0_g1~~TRINITY_DN7142_c0_g1_i1.p1  ORF type:complete len:459 (+),score=151.94 TRINITY_DN7142_c0_g1_i1:58-1434(+)